MRRPMRLLVCIPPHEAGDRDTIKSRPSTTAMSPLMD